MDKITDLVAIMEEIGIKPEVQKCPKCQGENKALSYDIFNFVEANDATLNCMHCDCLLIIKDGLFLDFHKYINETDAHWPIDGIGSNYVKI